MSGSDSDTDDRVTSHHRKKATGKARHASPSNMLCVCRSLEPIAVGFGRRGRVADAAEALIAYDAANGCGRIFEKLGILQLRRHALPGQAVLERRQAAAPTATSVGGPSRRRGLTRRLAAGGRARDGAGSLTGRMAR